MTTPQDKNQKNSKQKVTEVPPQRSATRAPEPIDYEYWKKMPSWTIKEALFLLLGIDPTQTKLQIKRALSDAIDQRADSNNPESKVEQSQQESHEILKIISLIHRAIKAGELECHSNIELDPYNPYQESEDFPVSPSDFIKWALEKNLSVPEELSGLVLQNNFPGEDVPPYLNPDHEFFTHELEAAIKAWVAVYEANGFTKKYGHKKQIKDWLKNNYTLSNAAIERIATVVNPKKRGGAPPTEIEE